jgi:hypothetical protein
LGLAQDVCGREGTEALKRLHSTNLAISQARVESVLLQMCFSELKVWLANLEIM